MHIESLNHFELIAAVLLLATAAGAIATLLRQPLIVAFIAVGILAGPVGLGLCARETSSRRSRRWASRCCCSLWVCVWTCR